MARSQGCTITEHESFREQGGESNEQATKATSYVRELGSLSCASKSGVVRVPVHGRGRRGVVEGMVGEGVSVGALAVVPFLRRMRNAAWTAGEKEEKEAECRPGEGACCPGTGEAAAPAWCAFAWA